MKTILVLGAGKSSYYVLDYLNSKAASYNWKILVYDKDAEVAKKKSHGMIHVTVAASESDENPDLFPLIENSDIVVSMLPAFMHTEIANMCLNLKKHLVTASYVSPEMREMDKNAKELDLVFANEMGLDPGIDHMSAKRIIDEVQKENGRIISFESYTGGLISEKDCWNNPWKYKFTWNPMNVIMAGQGGITAFKKNGILRYVPWHKVFAAAESVNIPALGDFDAYPNRDSLAYMALYGLESANGFIRGTLRRRNFCKAWQILVDLGLTDANEKLSSELIKPKQFIEAFTGELHEKKLSEWLINSGKISENLKEYFDYLQLESMVGPELKGSTAAEKLLEILNDKWALSEEDQDEIIMYHRIIYKIRDEQKEFISCLNAIGEDTDKTAMAKTVGLPVAIAVELILTGEIKSRGVQIPTDKQWYKPILERLETLGIGFEEHVK